MKKIHFIGIGGIGVSALARYYLAQGWSVSGSDLAQSEITQALQKLGVEFYVGTKTLAGIKPDLVVFSEAVPADNAERIEADSLNIESYTYARALGQLTKQYSTIAIAGAHGKSTTTAMIGLILEKAGLDPTVIVGTKVREFGDSNFREGKSRYIIIEACEYAKSFLNYWPKIAVVTNVEVDHLECYDTLDNLVQTFCEFVGHLPKDGILIANGDDNGTKKMLAGAMTKAKTVLFSVKQPESEKLRGLLKIPGEHNVANALAALAVARELRIDDKISYDVLSQYQGAWRRFEQHEIKFEGKNITLVVDYGHHPTQIKLTLEGARAKWPDRKITCVFQPHQALRTRLLFDDFVKVLQNVPVDRIIVTDIYRVAGRENEKIASEVSSEKLVRATAKITVEYAPQSQVLEILRDNIGDGEVLIIMGAGDIYDLARELLGNGSRAVDESSFNGMSGFIDLILVIAFAIFLLIVLAHNLGAIHLLFNSIFH